jgi:diguanylate cyclase (GGDEF)-like protein/PAS domain S-box-containing protein
MAEDRDFYREIIDNLHDGVYFVDPGRVITYWSKGAQRITGYASEQVVGRTCHDNLLGHVGANGEQLCSGRCPLAACLEDGRPREDHVFLHHADGHRVPVRVRVTPLRDADGKIIGAVEAFGSEVAAIDVHQELRQLRRTVHTDVLTGVYNRRYLERRLRAVVAELAGQTETAVGLSFLDIDGFKRINDRHGHEVGDRVLRMVAATLWHNVRRADVAGRWGGEEFLVILHDVASPEDLKVVVEKLRALVESSRLDLADQRVAVTISGGATLLRPGDSPESVVHRADALMYRSKEAGGNRVVVG